MVKLFKFICIFYIFSGQMEFAIKIFIAIVLKLPENFYDSLHNNSLLMIYNAQTINQKNNLVRMSHKIKSICLLCSLLISFLLFWLPVSAQSDFSAVEQLIKQNQKALGNNIAAAVWKDGKIIFQKQVEKEQGDFNAKTQAPIQTCGNWLIAALVMSFVEQGKLSLDDKVSKYIPIFSTYMKGYITIRNCLTNTTGIQTDGGIKALRNSKFDALEDQVNSLASKHEIEANPGTE